MRHITTVLIIIANAFLFCLYALISIIAVNFSYGLIIVNAWKNVPGSEDPIHMALAIGTTWIIALITFILRKYFYISFWENKNTKTSEKKSEKTIIKEKKETKKEENIFDDEIKIYIDKEIK